MSTLRGTNINPSPNSSEAETSGVFEKPTQEELAVREKEFRKWKDFLDTDEGKACETLAQVFIDLCDYELSLPSTAFMSRYQIPFEAVNEARAEVRGQKLVWDMILYRPQQLKDNLAKLEGTREVKKGEARWASPKK